MVTAVVDGTSREESKARWMTFRDVRSERRLEGIVPDIVLDNTPDGSAEAAKRPGLREENLPGHLNNPQQAPDTGRPTDQEREKQIPSSGPTGDETIDKDAQLKRALDLLKSWDVFKQVVQKRAA